MKSFFISKVKEHMKIGFYHKEKMYYGINAFILYTIGYIKYHIKKVKK
jgi:hypothetical protein